MELFISISEQGQAVCKFFAAAKQFFRWKIASLEKKHGLRQIKSLLTETHLRVDGYGMMGWKLVADPVIG